MRYINLRLTDLLTYRNYLSSLLWLCVCVLAGAPMVQYRHVAVLVGESVSMYCYAYFDWRHNHDIIVRYGQLVDNGTERFNFSCNEYSLMCQLTILDVQVEDSGLYSCDFGYTYVTVIRKLFGIFIKLRLSSSVYKISCQKL